MSSRPINNAANVASGLGARPPASGRSSSVVGGVVVSSGAPRLAGAIVVGSLSVTAHMVSLPSRVYTFDASILLSLGSSANSNRATVSRRLRNSGANGTQTCMGLFSV